MIAMAKKKPNSPDETPRPNRSGKPLHAWVRNELLDGLRRLAKRNRRTITAELEMALERHLAEGGIAVITPDEGGDE
jgi:hypothetical protein